MSQSLPHLPVLSIPLPTPEEPLGATARAESFALASDTGTVYFQLALIVEASGPLETPESSGGKPCN